METRSRKRAEAASSSSAPARSSKGARTSALDSAADAAARTPVPQPPPPPPPSLPPRRSRRTRTSPAVAPPAADPEPVPMDSGPPPPPQRQRGNKGKEQEPAESSRTARDAHRFFGLGDDDDADALPADTSAAAAFPHGLTSASSALQGLLRKLGTGLDELLPPSALSAAAAGSSQQGGRLKKILSGLRSDGEAGRQIEALTQLCEMLSIGTEESLGFLPIESLVPVLVGLLNQEGNPDIMLLAARALTHLCDVLPSSCAAVVHHGAVPCFCARLLTIEYMDLAEQSLQALKKISQEHPTACLRSGALMAVLSFLDFFSTGVQRVALATAANICRKLPADAADFVMEAVPLLTNLLNYHDSKVLEHASVCLTRIAEAFASSPEKLDVLCNHGLVAQAAALISLSNSGGQASLSGLAYTGLIRLLSTCANGSPLAAKTLLLLGISGTLKDILSGSGLVAGASVSSVLTRPSDQIFEIVTLADELLPKLPVGTISVPVCNNLGKGLSSKKSVASSSKQDDGPSTAHNEITSREKLLQDQPELLQQFAMDLLPILTQVYNSSINGPIRYKCLSVIGKITYYSPANLIETLLSVTNLSSFLAGVFAWKDPQALVPALQMADILMEKLPDIFSKMFVREGVLHSVDGLICPTSAAVPSHSVSLEKDNDSGSSSRSRRYRRRSGATYAEKAAVDELKSSVGNVAPPPNTSEVPSSTSSLRTEISELAKSFKEKYFSADSCAVEVGGTEDLLKLKTLCSKLNTVVDNNVKAKSKGKAKASAVGHFDSSSSIEEQLDAIISELLAELSKEDGVSTFEFIGSGVILSLLNYLSCGTFGQEKISEVNLPKLRQQALRRYKLFVSIALPVNVEGNGTPMALLVRKLQNALSSLERFPVILSPSSRSSSFGCTRPSYGLSALSRPLKLRFCRAHGEKSLRDYSSNVVLIDPLASVAAVEEFLWTRVQRSEPSQQVAIAAETNVDSGIPSTTADTSTSTQTPSSRRPSTRSRSSAVGAPNQDTQQEGSTSTSKGKGKAAMRYVSDERRGPQTRSASYRKAASDKYSEMKSAHGDSSPEDEELDASPLDMDDALMIDEDDISEDEDEHQVIQEGSIPLCVADGVHDVKLGDTTGDSNVGSLMNDSQSQSSSGFSSRNIYGRGSDAIELRSSAFGSRGAMSFAAAAMAGLASVSGQGIRGGRDRYGLPLGIGGHEHQNKLIFMSGGKELSKHSTIYQAVRNVLGEEDEDKYNELDMSSGGDRFWSDVVTIHYRKADTQTAKASHSGSKSSKSGSSKSASESKSMQVSLLDSILQGELPCDMGKSNPTYNILALLRVLEGLHQLAPRLRVQKMSDDFAEGTVPTIDGLYRGGVTLLADEFVNNKLTPKLARQIQDVLALLGSGLPSWCYQLTRACPFLFPFETRRQYFYSTAFGFSRALHRLRQQAGDNQSSGSEREFRIGRLQRQKVRVSRNRILDSAEKVMDMFASQKAVLEVEYYGEVGTGLGPTLEFYTLLSHELQKASLGLWRSADVDASMDISLDDDSKGHGQEHFIKAPLGLFPRPWPPKADVLEGGQLSKVVNYFRFVGQVMAKALQDGRLLDLPLSTAFYKLVIGQELDLYDILSFDSELGKILQEFQVLVNRKHFLESDATNDQQAVSDLRFRGAPVEDLCLDYTLPGHPDYLLKEGEENTIVNIDNLEEYVTLVVDATIKTGIMRQIEAFRTGFNQVFDITTLRIFSPHELDYLICGRQELWEPEKLVENMKFDHGYNAKSPAIINLLEIMAEFTPELQHAFCQFVTGAPRLPPGGLAALNPKLTIVRKHSASSTNSSNPAAAAESCDDDLPSVMTCANYLKLPPYSTKEIMYKKLLYAIKEGQGSFDLS